MPEYEMVREILNECPNNQMRDVFFAEVETDDPELYVRRQVKGEDVQIRREDMSDGSVVVHAACGGLLQRYTFTLDD